MMTKADLSALLKGVGVPVAEGENAMDTAGSFPRIVYWETRWQDVLGSGEDYESVVTYQISFLSNIPRDPKLLLLKQRLNAVGQHPEFLHEHVASTDSPQYFHSACTIDVIEALT